MSFCRADNKIYSICHKVTFLHDISCIIMRDFCFAPLREWSWWICFDLLQWNTPCAGTADEDIVPCFVDNCCVDVRPCGAAADLGVPSAYHRWVYWRCPPVSFWLPDCGYL